MHDASPLGSPHQCRLTVVLLTRGGARAVHEAVDDAVQVHAGLPVRGQRTRTNARTRKGPRKAIRVAAPAAAKPGK